MRANKNTIIAHRGLWRSKIEQNTLQAFKKALDFGIGIETDLCARNGEIVIAHDTLQLDSAISLVTFLELYQSSKVNSVLALNIKSSGLARALQKLLESYSISNYFVFDMSIPDTLDYLKLNMNVYLRMSEFEALTPDNKLFDAMTGIWVDCFCKPTDVALRESITHVERYIQLGKRVCFVSPELHAWGWEEEAYRKYWSVIRSSEAQLCTDHVDEAKKFFQEEAHEKY